MHFATQYQKNMRKHNTILEGAQQANQNALKLLFPLFVVSFSISTYHTNGYVPEVFPKIYLKYLEQVPRKMFPKIVWNLIFSIKIATMSREAIHPAGDFYSAQNPIQSFATPLQTRDTNFTGTSRKPRNRIQLGQNLAKSQLQYGYPKRFTRIPVQEHVR